MIQSSYVIMTTDREKKYQEKKRSKVAQYQEVFNRQPNMPSFTTTTITTTYCRQAETTKFCYYDVYYNILQTSRDNKVLLLRREQWQQTAIT